MINTLIYYIASSVLVVGMLIGIALMSKVKSAVLGNRLSAVCMFLAILITLLREEIFDLFSVSVALVIVPLAVGTVISFYWASRVKMIAMPETVALLNGFGGGASALVGSITLLETIRTATEIGIDDFSAATAGLAIVVGMITLTGSLIAAAKLGGLMHQKPTVWNGHASITTVSLLLSLVMVGLTLTVGIPAWFVVIACALVSGFFGVAFAIRIGGADMPITISLLNSLSGVAGSIAGMAIKDPLLVAVGGIVGASGLLLTQIMCRAMNRHLVDILMGRTTVSASASPSTEKTDWASVVKAEEAPEKREEVDVGALVRAAKRVIIIPGYGMALGQAQMPVKELADKFEARGAVVDYAIHPVAGRMPGHMNVLLAEVDVPYEKLREMDDINPDFATCDIAVIVGANDVVNPAARDAVGTPIYGMPILSVDEARHIIVCNLDLKPGYAGVDNPLYKSPKATLMLGDASVTVKDLIKLFN